jgi:lysyl-tRNA synthetase class II
MVAANGQPIDARTHIVNDQEWRARNRANDRFTNEAPRQSAFN